MSAHLAYPKTSARFSLDLTLFLLRLHYLPSVVRNILTRHPLQHHQINSPPHCHCHNSLSIEDFGGTASSDDVIDVDAITVDEAVRVRSASSTPSPSTKPSRRLLRRRPQSTPSPSTPSRRLRLSTPSPLTTPSRHLLG